MGSPLVADGLIRGRDGIVGPWNPPSPTQRPPHLNFDDAANLPLWERWVRASIIDFELCSRLAFTADAGTQSAAIWHAQFGGTATAPTATFQPLMKMVRPSEAAFAEQVALVYNYADLRGDRASEILSQLGGAEAFLASLTYLHPDRTPWTLDLIAAATRLANHVEQRIKHALASRRPHELSPQIQPMILTPSHSAFPSGHSTETFTSALVLWALLKDTNLEPYRSDPTWGEELMLLASRVAINRTIAGVHYPIDSAGGCVLGLTLGAYLVARCATSGTYSPWQFDGKAYPLPSAGNPPPRDGDFYWRELFDTGPSGGQKQTTYATPLSAAALPVDHSPILGKLWAKAREEWR